jgi:ATP-binding cassette subfamily B multidrug efflux pump
VIASQEELAALSDQILESYHGVRVVQDYDAADAVTKRFDRRNNRYRDLQLSIARVRAFLLPIVVVVGNMSILVLLYWGGRMVADSSLHFGAVSAFTVYVANIVMSLTTLGWVVNVIQRGTISLRRILDVLDVEPGLPPVSDELPDGPLDINVSGLGFSYPDSGRAAVLDDVSFSVSAGDSVGIFGSTGSGKTTLLRLMTRLETPPPGTVKIGGVDVRDVDIMQLRAAMSVVPQHAYLFSRSIKDNIFLGDSASENDEEKMIEAVADAALIDDLEVLRDGIDTVVGERGVTLSGGQRQRTSLARAFYRDARILILDDTLSAVDHDTEMRLIGVIFERSAGQTAVIVSHRVSVLRHTDHILVLDEGAVVESGTHDTLLAQGGVYASEWQIHLRHEHHEEERPDAG